ncbi:hypothetical protein UPYG_G00327020 [Umbra pygmaea]|uniref:C2H2-type domain-containing protein n=1 Tax=Umbra pygmaea TaxID=75934 RepID=A0ABD0W1E6_UMBPY
MRQQPRCVSALSTQNPRNHRKTNIPFARKREVRFVARSACFDLTCQRLSMSSSSGADEDEVEFVSEAPLRPVLECIDLLSEDEEEGGGTSPKEETIEDEIERQKAHVSSTLDKLACKVALAKKERAEKCKAFKEKQILQQAHVRQELACSPAGHTRDAKHCVDLWLKMPGVSSGSNWRCRSLTQPISRLATHTCPVTNCGRIYDSAPLLDGHLKRFDHSPCDPTIYLKGSASELFACVDCGLHFLTQVAWMEHRQSKLSSNDGDHKENQTCQSIVCFACPACYLLFYIRDECLQHMSAKNHITQSIAMSDTKGTALPVPIPRYAKNRLIALCKEVPYSVRCTTCRKALHSHMEAQAHFNVQCRQGGARAEAEKTVAQVMKRLRAFGQCAVCNRLFTNPSQVEEHRASNQHPTEINSTMETALLHFCNFYEIQNPKRKTSRPQLPDGPLTPSQKRDNEVGDSVRSPAKRQRLGGILNGSAGLSKSGLVVAWFCECGQRYSEEAAVSKHLLAANQIFHQCGVCGKHMGESSIARLHMSRFHGGAHLSNILFHCRLCKVDMPRQDDILLHVSENHSGHTFFSEREVPDMDPVPYAKPSTSGRPRVPVEPRSATGAPAPTPERRGAWMCRMCEDVFDSERAVHKHCGDVNSHRFQRFACGHCPQKFFKETTLHRHCVNEHGNQVVTRFFCGLCDSMEYETEEEFQEHYQGLHSKDYYHMDEPEDERPAEAHRSDQPATTKEGSKCLCPCMSSDKDKDERKATFTRCMKRLSREEQCSYVCAPCNFQVSSFPHIKTHIHTKHDALGLEKTFTVVCGLCLESHKDVPSFHNHYHSQHCSLEPCLRSRDGGQSSTQEAAVKTWAPVDNKPRNEEGFSDVTKAIARNLVVSENAGANGDESDEEIKHALALSVNETRMPSDSIDEFDEEIKHALALSVNETRMPTDFDIEMEEALKRSILEY